MLVEDILMISIVIQEPCNIGKNTISTNLPSREFLLFYSCMSISMCNRILPIYKCVNWSLILFKHIYRQSQFYTNSSAKHIPQIGL